MPKRSNNESWKKIYNDLHMDSHDFDKAPFKISAEQIKQVCQGFTKVSEKEVRILCKIDKREHRPEVFRQNNLFILPITNGEYIIVRGEGYVDIPPIDKTVEVYASSLDYKLETSLIGDSEMQHIDFAFASSLIRTFMNDKSLVLTIRGRKYTPEFSFKCGKHLINVNGVQTEVDAGYEGRNQIVLIEAKKSNSKNTIIRQLFYPYKQWSHYTKKKVVPVFFEMSKDDVYSFWEFGFSDDNVYNSIYLKKTGKYRIKNDYSE